MSTTHRPSSHWLARSLQPLFAVEHRIPGGTVRLRLIGEVDVSAVGLLRAVVRKVQRDADGALVLLDFELLELLSVAAARVLIAEADRYRSEGGRVVVQHVRPHVDHALRLVHLDRSFEIIDAARGPALRREPPRSTDLLPPADSVLVQGELSPRTMVMLQRALWQVLAGGRRPVVVDLRDAFVSNGESGALLDAALQRFVPACDPLTVLGTASERTPAPRAGAPAGKRPGRVEPRP